MRPPVETLLVLGAIIAAAALGMLSKRVPPEHHLGDGTRVHYAATISVVATLAALVMGFAISNANTNRLAMMQDVALMSSNIIRAGALLSRYGPEANDAHDTLARYATQKRQDLFPQAHGKRPALWDPVSDTQLDQLQRQIIALHPKDGLQRFQQSQALEASNQIIATQWTIAEQRYAIAPNMVIVFLTYSMMVLFFTYGLFTPNHVTAVVAIFLSATAIAAAIMIILQGRMPFDGVAAIPFQPLADAVAAVQRCPPAIVR